MFTTPVALFVFNRPKNAASVLGSIRKAQPARLFVVADGPRPANASDERDCAATRSIVDAIDWSCEVKLNFASANLGMKTRFATGLKWLFDQVEEAIILEDDCLPDLSFFRFCAELLERYRNDGRIAMINGTRFPISGRDDGFSYHFSTFGAHWGWATWKRAWLDYDPEMKAWADPETRRRLAAALPDEESRHYWLSLFDRVWTGAVNAWDCQWTLGQVLAQQLAIVPGVNLISNTGFSEAGSHTRTPLSSGANVVRRSMPFPLSPPTRVEPDSEYDARYVRWRIGRPDADSLLQATGQLMQVNRNAQALLLIEAYLRKEVVISGSERELLLAARSRALLRLRSAIESPISTATGGVGRND